MKIISALPIAFVLAACGPKPIERMSYTELKTLADEIDARCLAAGEKPGTPNWQICVNQEVSKERSDRDAAKSRAEAAAAIIAATGNGLSAGAQQMPTNIRSNPWARGATCTSKRQYDGSIKTECY